MCKRSKTDFNFNIHFSTFITFTVSDLRETDQKLFVHMFEHMFLWPSGRYIPQIFSTKPLFLGDHILAKTSIVSQSKVIPLTFKKLALLFKTYIVHNCSWKLNARTWNTNFEDWGTYIRLRWTVFHHMTCLGHLRARRNIWWLINLFYVTIGSFILTILIFFAAIHVWSYGTVSTGEGRRANRFSWMDLQQKW